MRSTQTLDSQEHLGSWSSNKTVTGVGSRFNKELRVGDVVVSSGNTFSLYRTISSNTSFDRDPTTGGGITSGTD